jgi:microcin C transport system substrate-binding protein
VLRHGWYLVPHFHLATHRVAFSYRLGYPDKLPTYYAAQPWMSRTWWFKQDPQIVKPEPAQTEQAERAVR